MGKVLLFYFSELGGLGGVEVAVLRLAEEFSKLGWPSGIIEIGQHGKARRMLPNGIPVWGVAGPSYPTIRRPRSWASFARSAWQFMKIVFEFAPDIVHVHYPISQVFPVVGAHTVPHRWRLVVTVHNSDIRVSPYEEPRIRPWQARLFSRANAVTAVSEGLLDDATELYPQIAGKGSVIYNGVSSMWFQAPTPEASCEDKYVLFVGRLHVAKGIDVLLRSWKTVSGAFPNLELWLVGDGPELQSLQLLAKELEISSRVRFLGRRPQSELPSLYNKAQVVVLPSRREGLPFSLLEAQAAGAICIGTRIPGIQEVIEDGTTGFLVHSESPETLASAITRVLALTTEQRFRIKCAAHNRVREQFSEHRMISNYLRLFQSVIGTEG